MKTGFDSLVDHLIGAGFFLEEAVEILEKTYIQRAMEKTRGNRSAASKMLGIHRNTLQRKMNEYELAPAKIRRKPVRNERASRRKLKTG